MNTCSNPVEIRASSGTFDTISRVIRWNPRGTGGSVIECCVHAIVDRFTNRGAELDLFPPHKCPTSSVSRKKLSNVLCGANHQPSINILRTERSDNVVTI